MTAETGGDRGARVLRILFLVFAMAAFAAIAAFAYLAAKSPPPGRSAPPVASPVEGIVVSVDAVSLGDVRGFSLRASDGTVVAFKVGALENPTDFPPGHLAEHQATSSPVRVFFTQSGDDLVAYRLEDAPG